MVCSMKTVATKDILSKLDRIERLLVANLLQAGAAGAQDLKLLGYTDRELRAAKKSAVDFDITKYVPRAHVKQWK